MSSRTHRGTSALTAVAAGAGLLAALASCNTSTKAAPALPVTAAPAATPSSTAAPTPTATAATPSPTPTNPTDLAIAQAQDAVRRYYKVMDTILSDPSVNQARAREVTISTGLVDAYNRISFNRSRGYRETGGTTRIISMNSRVVTLTNKPHQQPPLVPEVKIAVCYDVKDVGFVDATGKSIVTANRKSHALERVSVANYDWPNPQGWRIASSEVKGESCENPAT